MYVVASHLCVFAQAVWSIYARLETLCQAEGLLCRAMSVLAQPDNACVPSRLGKYSYATGKKSQQPVFRIISCAPGIIT